VRKTAPGTVVSFTLTVPQGASPIRRGCRSRTRRKSLPPEEPPPALRNSWHFVSPKGLRKIARGCLAAATLGDVEALSRQPRRGCVICGIAYETPLGFTAFLASRTLGSRCAATLGCPTKALRANSTKPAHRRGARGRGQDRQGGGNRTGKPLPRPVATRQSTAVHPLCRDESNGIDAHGRDCTLKSGRRRGRALLPAHI